MKKVKQFCVIYDAESFVKNSVFFWIFKMFYEFSFFMNTYRITFFIFRYFRQF